MFLPHLTQTHTNLICKRARKIFDEEEQEVDDNDAEEEEEVDNNNEEEEMDE